jgi:hypothetical protein
VGRLASSSLCSSKFHVNVFEERGAPREREVFDLVDRAGDLSVEFVPENRVLRVVGQAERHEVPLEPNERILPFPRADLLFGAISRRIVARGVGPDPVGHCLDEGRPKTRSRAAHRVRHDLKDGEHIVAVDPNAGHAISPPLESQARTRGLARHGDADRPVVVLTDENARRFEDGREVHGRVEVALARGAVAHEADRDALGPFLFHGPRGADGVWELGPDARRPRHLVDLTS